MKYLDEYRNKDLVDKLVAAIRQKSRKKIKLMEVCGGHTMAIRKFGIQHMLPPQIELLSGPGCPVCVTGRSAIDHIIALARIPGNVIATYGDLIRIPGSESDLNRERAAGADVRIVFSTLEALALAKKHPCLNVIFPGIGFETTTPSTAVAILEAQAQKIPNFQVLSLHKLMPPAMGALIEQGVKIDGFIGPGHVSAVSGSGMYNQLLKQYGISIVISGFEPVDLLQSILMLTEMIEAERHGVEIQYKRVVTESGNVKARSIVEKVFMPVDDEWRGLGVIPGSGLAIRPEYGAYDVRNRLNPFVQSTPEPAGCICGAVLRGMRKPSDCTLFSKACTPANPIGACMVSGEGACQAYYNFR